MKDKISGIFLFFAIVLGNFLDTTVGHKLENYLNNSTISKFIIIFIIIFFTVHFSNKDIIHPFEHLKHSMIIFILYILMTRNYLFISILCFILIIVNFIINTYVTYYEERKNNEKIKEFEKYSFYMTRIIILIIFISFFICLFKNKKNLRNFLK